MDLDTLLKKLSTREKIALCEGADFWHTRDLSDQELPALTMADGTTVELLMPILAYKEELDLCDEIGVDAVIDEILESNRGSFALDVRRANVAAGGAYE